MSVRHMFIITTETQEKMEQVKKMLLLLDGIEIRELSVDDMRKANDKQNTSKEESSKQERT